MRIISIRQPWASLIITGGTDVQTGGTVLKDIENRTWRTLYRGPMLVHASQRRDEITDAEIEKRFGVKLGGEQPLGGVVGIVNIIDCVRSSGSVWHAPGCWGFRLANPRPLPFIRWKGALSLRAAPAELLTLIDEQIKRAA